MSAPPAPPLLLASTSPQRRAILAQLGLPFDVVAPGERVGDGIVIRQDRQSVALQVVAGVDDDRQTRADDGLQPVGQLGAADPTGKLDDPRHVSRGVRGRRGRGSGS